ncbi:MAG: SlyX family protein [Alphaproteobacteria bacterium]|nr:SlyX family protein [Alphaproteobacteria bacterium]
MQQDEERLVDIEMVLANHEKMLDELNAVIIEQGKIIEKLQRQNMYLMNLMEGDAVKPQSEETPPPHY